MTDTTKLQSIYERIAASESEVHWILGDQLVADVAAGYKLDDLAEMCEPIFKKGRTAIRNHHKVATVFPDDTYRAKELSWSMHRLAATTCNLKRPQDYQNAHDWINKASEGEMTYDALADAIAVEKGTKETNEPVYLCKRVPAHIHGCNSNGDADKVLLEIFISKDDALGFEEHFDKWWSGDNKVLLTMFIPAAKVHSGEQSEAEAA
jgi:hypothetical protein